MKYFRNEHVRMARRRTGVLFCLGVFVFSLSAPVFAVGMMDQDSEGMANQHGVLFTGTAHSLPHSGYFFSGDKSDDTHAMSCCADQSEEAILPSPAISLASHVVGFFSRRFFSRDFILEGCAQED
ncbi:MAG: hypothetical protein WBO66_05695, partial [Candidatus Moraniibacteriota bacterium]